MKESIMSFFNAPITNKVPSGVCSVAGLHAYISSDSHLKELTQREIGRASCRERV